MTGATTRTTHRRVLGLLGGMAWPSTLEAYRLLNERVGAARGGTASPELLLWSADFAEVEALQAAGDWDAAGALLADAARRLEMAGAGALVLLTNTMHRVAPAIERATAVPLLHVADATATAVHDVLDGAPSARSSGGGRAVVGLLGTAFTMEEPGVRDRLAAHGLEVAVPGASTRAAVHAAIYDELVHGRVPDRVRRTMREAAAGLVAGGAGVVVAGCTEIELALAPDDVAVPLVATTATLVDAAVAWVLDGAVPPRPQRERRCD